MFDTVYEPNGWLILQEKKKKHTNDSKLENFVSFRLIKLNKEQELRTWMVFNLDGIKEKK